MAAPILRERQAGFSLKEATLLELGPCRDSMLAAPPHAAGLGSVQGTRTTDESQKLPRCHPSCGVPREFIPFFSLQPPTAGLWRFPAPLLEEERNTTCATLIPELAHPVFFNRTRSGPAFPSGDYPVNASKIDLSNRSNHRFDRQEANRSIRLLEMSNARYPRCILDRHTQPNVIWRRRAPVALINVAAKKRAPLRKNLKYMPIGTVHRIEHLIDV